MSGSSVVNDISMFSPAPTHGWFSTSGLQSIRADEPDGLDSYMSVPVRESSADLRKIFPQEFGSEGAQVTLEIRIFQGVNVPRIVITAVGNTGDGHSITAPAADGEWHTVSGRWVPEKPGLTQLLIVFPDAFSPANHVGVDIKSIKVEA